MAPNTHINSDISISVAKPNVPTDLKDRSIPEILKWIMFEGTEKLRRQKLDELKKLSTSQQEIAFLNNLQRIFTLGANEDGTFNVNADMKKLLERVFKPGGESLMQVLNDLGLTFNANHSEASFQALFDGIESLEDADKSQQLLQQLSDLGIVRGQKPTEQQLSALVEFVSQPENIELRGHLADQQILTTKDKFTKPERENFIESIRLEVQQRTTINEMTSQTAMRLQGEIDKIQMFDTELLKTHKKIFDAILANMRRS